MIDHHLVCTGCGATFPDDGARLTCVNDHGPALLRSVYPQTAFAVGTSDSMLRYDAWLPKARPIATNARTGVYRSTALGAHLGLRRLWIAFSGWWPERDATLPTATFKDLEAVAVLRRRRSDDTRTLVISSAGNTALAFGRACSDNDIPALIIVPMRGWHDVLADIRFAPCVRVVAIADASYDEAIVFAREVCANGDFILEGGVRNIGRRDGMGTAMLAAVEAIGALPDVYFQAVGSAAGALAAHEAALRVIGDGRFGDTPPRLMLSQNAPFTPIHDAWTQRRTRLVPRSAALATQQIAQLGAFVLSNVAPPYDAAGGVRAALDATDGETAAIGNAELRDACALFARCEGRSLEPASGVALAHLIRAVASSRVTRDTQILLHITGGGRVESPYCASHGGNEPALTIARDEPASIAIDRTRALIA